MKMSHVPFQAEYKARSSQVSVQTKRGRPMLWCSLSSIQIISDVSQNQLSAAKPV